MIVQTQAEPAWTGHVVGEWDTDELPRRWYIRQSELRKLPHPLSPSHLDRASENPPEWLVEVMEPKMINEILPDHLNGRSIWLEFNLESAEGVRLINIPGRAAPLVQSGQVPRLSYRYYVECRDDAEAAFVRLQV